MRVPQPQIWTLSRRSHQLIRFHPNIPQPYLGHHGSRHVSTIRFTPPDILADENIEHFRHKYFQAEEPALLRSADLCLKLPAYNKWFLETTNTNHGHDDNKEAQLQLNYDYVSKYGDSLVPLEMTSSDSQGSENNSNNIQFERFQAPLSMFLDWTAAAAKQQKASSSNSNTNNTTTNNNDNVRIYLAQCHIEDLPSQLQSDFHPTPSLVSQTGKNDVYATNIWIGAPPTYTPLHKDPNPNLFVQLAGMKHVRLLPPDAGLRVFAGVRQQQQQQQQEESYADATFRGNEMMQGSERVLLERAVWGDVANTNSPSSSPSDVHAQNQIGYDVILKRSDALFIPKGWWHSIKGVGEGITASVNWWFR